MRRLRPNSKGVLVPTTDSIPAINAQPYTKPTNSLIKLDRILKTKIPKILIVRSQGGIGDVLMTLPTVRAISKKYDIKVDYATDFDYLDGALVKVLDGNPYIDKVISWRVKDNEDYDAVIDLTCPCIAHEVPHAKSISRIELFARHAQIQLTGRSIDYYIKDDERKAVQDFIYSKYLQDRKILIVQPFSSVSERNAPSETLKHAIVSILSQDNSVTALIITHGSSDSIREWDIHKNVMVVNNWDIRQLAAIIEQSSCVLCQDSAILHIAGALNKKTVALFGPTDAKARVCDYPNAIGIVPGHDLKCHHCWYMKCNVGYVCWKRLQYGIISDTVSSVLNNKPILDSPELVTFGSFKKTKKIYELL